MNQTTTSLEVLTQNLIEELQLQEESPEAQTYLLEKLGRNIFARVVAELYTILPEEKHAELEGLMGANDVKAFATLTQPHIPDFGLFVQTEARKEIEQVKQLMQEELKNNPVG